MNYNALNLQLTRRLSNGFTMSAIYTYSKSLDQVSNGDGANSNATRRILRTIERVGAVDYDTRHRITVSGVYELPHVHSAISQ